jgi:hypothetical protein
MTALYPTRLWFRTQPGEKYSQAWTRFYSMTDIEGGHAARGSVAAARLAYPHSCAFWFSAEYTVEEGFINPVQVIEVARTAEPGF